jgi:hypothetical protein
VAAVLGAPATRELLVPALMRVYGQADFVVGLDVDRWVGGGGRLVGLWSDLEQLR